MNYTSLLTMILVLLNTLRQANSRKIRYLWGNFLPVGDTHRRNTERCMSHSPYYSVPVYLVQLGVIMGGLCWYLHRRMSIYAELAYRNSTRDYNMGDRLLKDSPCPSGFHRAHSAFQRRDGGFAASPSYRFRDGDMRDAKKDEIKA